MQATLKSTLIKGKYLILECHPKHLNHPVYRIFGYYPSENDFALLTSLKTLDLAQAATADPSIKDLYKENRPGSKKHWHE